MNGTIKVSNLQVGDFYRLKNGKQKRITAMVRFPRVTDLKFADWRNVTLGNDREVPANKKCES